MTAITTPHGSVAPRTAVRASHLTDRERVVVALVFFYWLVYENLVFFYSRDFGGTGLYLVTNVAKLLLPFGLLAYTGVPSARAFARGHVAIYLLFFTLFLGWAAVPTIVTGDPVAWFKLLPRFAFFLSTVALFTQRSAAFTLFAKCVVVYVLSALVQYVLLYATGAYASYILTPNGMMAGPFGLFGNVTSAMWFPSIPVPFLRVTGFWNEPSNASASAFASVFLSRYLAEVEGGKFWRRAAIACGIAGLLTFSNAGYLAFASALLASLAFDSRAFNARRVLQLGILLFVVVGMLLVAFLGRRYVAENYPDNVWARAITGARGRGDDDDPTGGRLALLRTTASTVQGSIIGLGIQEVGSGGIESSASAPLYWLLLTGIPGLAFLLAREAALLSAAIRLARQLPGMRFVGLALIAVMAQQAVYGSWMNPNYLILAAMVLACTSNAARGKLDIADLRA